jgi:hypothetical protein
LAVSVPDQLRTPELSEQIALSCIKGVASVVLTLTPRRRLMDPARRTGKRVLDRPYGPTEGLVAEAMTP